jgi:hypothetical protein
MFRLIGAIIVVLLVVAPVLLRAGVPDHTGLLREFVDLETRFFVDVVDTIRALGNRYFG